MDWESRIPVTELREPVNQIVSQACRDDRLERDGEVRQALWKTRERVDGEDDGQAIGTARATAAIEAGAAADLEVSIEPGVSVALLARAHAVSANQIFHWRKLHRERVAGGRGRESRPLAGGALGGLIVSRAARRTPGAAAARRRR